MQRVLAALVTAISILALAAPAHAARTVYRGQWQCDDRGTIAPLGGIELQLWRRGWDWLPVELSGSIDSRGFTNADGTFALTASNDEDTHFVRMALRDAARVRLKDFWGINDWSIDSIGARNDVAERTIGGLLLSTSGQSHKCAIWRGFHSAYQDFRDITGTEPATGGGLLINADAITAGVPFTAHTTVMWPGGFPAGYSGGGDDSITRHEFGHVIRHGFDGDLGHFLGDVVTHNYLQQHQACNKTGLGFAFNEGWAEYWARDYGPAPACDGRAPDDYEVEGNVAAALTDIETRCYAGRRAPMVDILRNHPGVIHSFQEFRAFVTCPAPLVAASPAPVTAAPLRIAPAQGAAIARAQVSALGAQVRHLQFQLRSALRDATRIPACVRAPCNAALRRATRPAGLRIDIALAKLARSTVDDGDTVAEQQKFDKLGIADALKLMKAKEKANRARAAAILVAGTRAVLKAGRPIFVKDPSAATRHMRTLLTTRLATFRTAQKGTGGLPGLTLDDAITDRIRKVAQRVFPAPVPVPNPTPAPGPAPDPRVASTLTLECPSATKPGTYALHGTLSPVLAGVEVELHITPPGGAEVVQSTKTDAAGAYTSSASLMQTGTWKIFAGWAGDASTLPDDSPTCEVPVS